jgi:hypothetical protein
MEIAGLLIVKCINGPAISGPYMGFPCTLCKAACDGL